MSQDIDVLAVEMESLTRRKLKIGLKSAFARHLATIFSLLDLSRGAEIHSFRHDDEQPSAA
jgi:hypothetical protein